VHGAQVVEAGATGAAGPHQSSPAPTGDAAVTARPGLPMVVLTADCAPVAIASDHALAVVHAGWPGLLQGVLERAVERLRTSGDGRLRAALGPCIHPERYEFGGDDLARLVDRLGPGVASRTADGRPALDIPAGVRIALSRAGVDDLLDVGVCTSASPDYFSHRRDGPTGRQGLIAVLEE
jgi:copper oxidase (laccase) domain-containing protein